RAADCVYNPPHSKGASRGLVMSVAGPWFLSELAAGCVGWLLLLSPLAILIARRRHGSGLIYGACALASCALALPALLALLSPSPPAAIELAVGLPPGRSWRVLTPPPGTGAPRSSISSWRPVAR